MSKLLKMYVLAFLPLGLTASAIMFFASPSKLVVLWIPILAAILLPSVLLHLWATFRYKRAHRQAAGQENPKFWSGAPAAEKREVIRRLAGVHGGAMIFLAIWGILTSGGTKLMTGAFPWQCDRLTSQPLEREARYVTDLLDGKIEVPQKYIDEVEEREKRNVKPQEK